MKSRVYRRWKSASRNTVESTNDNFVRKEIAEARASGKVWILGQNDEDVVKTLSPKPEEETFGFP